MKFKRPSWSQVCWMIGIALASIYPLRVANMRRIEKRRVHSPSSYVFPSRELAQLDKLLQVRFAERPTNDFGMGRIGQRHEIFKAITQAEHEAIQALKHQKQDVVFYVASRDYLTKGWTAGAYKTPLQGPVFMTQNRRSK